MEKLEYPYLWMRKKGEYVYYRKNLRNALFAKGNKDECIIHFSKTEEYICNISLKTLHLYVWAGNLFRRWHKSYLICRQKVKDARWRRVIFENNEEVRVNPHGYEKAVEYLREKNL